MQLFIQNSSNEVFELNILIFPREIIRAICQSWK